MPAPDSSPQNPASFDPKAAYDAALDLFKRDRLDDAARLLKEILAKAPHYEDAYEALSICYSKLNRVDEAIETARQWVRVNPQRIMAHTNLSRFYMQKDLIAEAEKAQAEARRLGWIEELRHKKQELPAADPEEKIERYKKVIELDPKDVLGYFTLGSTYLELERHREAAQTFLLAVQADPGHSSSYLGLGQAYQALGETEKAIEIYRKGIICSEEKGDMVPLKKMTARLAELS